MRTATLLLALFPLVASCGGSADPVDLTKSGEKALGTRDYAAAHEDFEAALETIAGDTSHAMYLRAKLGAIEASAVASVSDGKAAAADLVALHKAMPTKVTDSDFNRIAGKMGDAENFKGAKNVLAAGKQIFPDSKHLDKLGNKLLVDAKKAGDTETSDALSGLGYTGGD